MTQDIEKDLQIANKALSHANRNIVNLKIKETIIQKTIEKWFKERQSDIIAALIKNIRYELEDSTFCDTPEINDFISTKLLKEIMMEEKVRIRPPEKEIYEQMYSLPEYREESPGRRLVEDFLFLAKPKSGSTILDIGCGTGRASVDLADKGGLNVTMLDFASNSLDKDIAERANTPGSGLRFIECDITKKLPAQATYGFCVDVMEHVRPEDVDAVLDNILQSCQNVFFQIANFQEGHGKALVGYNLHLTIQPYEWWLKKLADRDCYIQGSSNIGSLQSVFYVTSAIFGLDITAKDLEQTRNGYIRKNVRDNINSKNWQQARPAIPSDTKIMLIGSGPSLLGQIDEIKHLCAEGVKPVAINGAYKWCLENGIKPAAFIMSDPERYSSRYPLPVAENCLYYIASQCDPNTLVQLPKERTFLWHVQIEVVRDLLEKKYGTNWWGIAGNSSTTLLAIPLVCAMGIRHIHLFGVDSCFTNDKHHAFELPRGADNETHTLPIRVGEKEFKCYLWMARQAQDFLGLINSLDDDVDLDVHGEGILSYMINLGANMAMKEEEKS